MAVPFHLSAVSNHHSTRPANQKRSEVLRDELVEAGFNILALHELDSLSIRTLAAQCNVSVGAFYKRFTSKEGFLRVLQSVVTHDAEKQAALIFDPSRMQSMGLVSCITDFVQFMNALFNGYSRGVIRASYRGSGKNIDTWEPLRESSRKIRNLFGTAIINKLPNPESDLEKIHFVYQMVNGVLINNLLNPWHVYRPENPALQRELIRMAIAYLKAPQTAQET